MQSLSLGKRDNADWWNDFLQEWNYLIYLRARKCAWLTLVYPVIAIPSLWTLHTKIKTNDTILAPILLTIFVLFMFGVSAYLLFGYKSVRSAASLTQAQIKVAALYIVCLVIILNSVFTIVWSRAGLNSPYLVGLPILSILFLRISKVSLLLYAINSLFYFVFISLFEFPAINISVAYVSGAIATVLGLLIANSTFNSKLNEFITRRTIEQQKAELASAYLDIYELNNTLRSDNFRMGLELSIAREMQDMILPKKEELKSIEFLDIAALMSPATEVGGDYFDVLVDRDHQTVTIGIGDVTGHGLESGIFTVMIQSAVRLIHHCNHYDLTEAINLLNVVLYENAQRMASDKMVTFVLLHYKQGKIQICGQHEDIILVRHNGILQTIDTSKLGFPLGLERDISAFVHQEEIDFNPGDVLVLYTDGITEAMSPAKEIYGLERLKQTIVANHHRSAEEIRQAITENVMDFISTATIFDDITLLVVKQI